MEKTGLGAEVYQKHRSELCKKLKPNSLAIINSNDAMPRCGDQTYPFRQNSDLLYLCGIEQEKTILILFPDHPVESLREIIIVQPPDLSHETWYGHLLTPEEVTAISGIKTVKFLDQWESVIHEMMTRVSVVYLNMNEYPRFTTEVPSRDLRMAHKLRELYPIHTYDRLAPLIMEQRMVKDEAEIEQIKKACNITKSAYLRLLDRLRPGMSEYAVEAEITHEFLRLGARSHAYPPIVASGKNACVLHYNTNREICRDGQLLLIDFGAEVENYAADCTRTIPVNGKFSPRQADCYNAVLRVFKEVKKMFVPGNTIDIVYKETCNLLEKEMIRLGLFTEEEVKNQNPDQPLYMKYFMHGISHFMGLDVHDCGTKQHVFKTGMVLSCEPGLYIPEENLGIRIETDIVVADDPIDLMADFPIEIEEIEEKMNKNR